MSDDNKDVDPSLPKILLREFGRGMLQGAIILNKIFSCKFVYLFMTGLCLANMLILAELTVRWKNGGYASKSTLILGTFNTLFLLYWWPLAKPHLFKSKKSEGGTDVGSESRT